MEAKEYQKLAMRTNDGKCTQRLLVKEDIVEGIVPDFGGALNACLGLSGEVGETNDMIKKWVYHGHDLDRVKLMKELGDILWYVAMMCESFGFSMDAIMQINIKSSLS